MEDGTMTKPTYTWSLATRLFHLLLLLSVAITYLVSDFENLLSFHVIFGYTIALLFSFRILWGFMDVKHSKFSDFIFSPRELLYYMTHMFHNKKEYAGHNPASSWAIVAMILFAFLAVLSGALTYGTQEGMGLFSSLNHTFFKDMELFEEIHEFFANLFMLVVGAHIAGVVLDTLLHRSDVIASMVSGYKSSSSATLKLTFMQKIFGILWILTPLLFAVYMLSRPTNPLLKDANVKISYQQEQPLFAEECSSCHTLYPPFLLPRASWAKMMDNLEDYFGNDASLENEDTLLIRNYLLSYAAESSTKESALKILKSIENNATIAITKTPYWVKRHKEIDKEVFKSQKVKKISNCKACHQNFENGLLNDKDIQIPKG